MIGCGLISRNHVEGYRALYDNGCREFDVVACCDLDRAKAEERANEIAEFRGPAPAVYDCIDDMLAAGVAEAADTCLPHCFHHTVAIQLFDGGLHVMVEKPLGLTVRASQLIIEAAQKAGKVLATGENVRRDLGARACEWAINRRKLIGDMALVTVQSISHDPFDYERAAMKWRGLKLLTGGGMIMDSGAHFGDMIQVLFGDVDEVYCTMQSLDDRLIMAAPILGDAPADVEDTWHAVIRFKSGLHVVWTYSRSLYHEGTTFGHYYGKQGTLHDQGFAFHPFQGGGMAVLADGATLQREDIEKEFLASFRDGEKERLFPYGVTDGFGVAVWDFVNAVATGRKPEMDGADGLRAKALCECCYESATLGAPVAFDDVLSGKVDAYQRPINAFWKI